ncbi:copper amine oxidase N-terminal domain-containing protein, partial [Anaeromicrobium sediminis]
INGRVCVPLGEFIRDIGGSVSYDGATRTIQISQGETDLEFVQGSSTAKLDGEPIAMDHYTIDGRVMIPIRFIGETLGLDVEWDGDTKTVILTDETNSEQIAKIEGIAQNGDASSITIEDIKDAGVTESKVLDGNLLAYQAAIVAAEDGALNTKAKIEDMVDGVNLAQAAVKRDAIAKIEGIAKNGDASSITIKDIKDAGVTVSKVLDGNLSAYQAAIAAVADGGLDTIAKIEDMVDIVNSVLE